MITGTNPNIIIQRTLFGENFPIIREETIDKSDKEAIVTTMKLSNYSIEQIKDFAIDRHLSGWPE